MNTSLEGLEGCKAWELGAKLKWAPAPPPPPARLRGRPRLRLDELWPAQAVARNFAHGLSPECRQLRVLQEGKGGKGGKGEGGKGGKGGKGEGGGRGDQKGDQ